MGGSKTLSSIVHVLLVDNDPLVQLGAKALLNQQPGWVVRSTGDCTSALELSIAYKPQVVLLGIDSATEADIEKVITLKGLSIPLVAYGNTMVLNDLHKILAAGADSFIHRSVSRESLVSVINDCIQGRHTILTGNESNLLYGILRNKPQPVKISSLLTDRERDVLACILQGMSNTEIASQLNITTGTVKAHIGHLLRKHGVSSRTKLAVHVARYSQEN